MNSNRKFLRFFDSEEYEKVVPESDEQKKVAPPLFQQPYPEDAKLIDLIPPEKFTIGKTPFLDLVNSRISRRKYTEEPIFLEELSFLLWCTQGIKKILKSRLGVKRTVPSAGAKSPLETYLVVNRVDGLEPGLYRYISFTHQLMYIKQTDDAEEKIGELAFNQKFVGRAPLIFCWTAVPYRTEWRYTILSHKFIAIDLGIVSQSLYMACEAINLGTVAIGYYEQNKMDELFELDSDEEFVVLLAPVGKYKEEKKLSEFFKYPKREITPEDLAKLIGKYKRKNEVEFIVKDDNLVVKVGEFEEILDPYNETEFIGEFSSRALRFEFTEKGKPEKVIVLTTEDEIVELEYLE
ncbi:MAG: SagB/ThcOx family dehydrogenase [Asgard group archaeon]|nr:SagB/ThcOx family dehydrogenase [Asgard group archaeon]